MQDMRKIKSNMNDIMKTMDDNRGEYKENIIQRQSLEKSRNKYKEDIKQNILNKIYRTKQRTKPNKVNLT